MTTKLPTKTDDPADEPEGKPACFAPYDAADPEVLRQLENLNARSLAGESVVKGAQ